MAGALIKGLLGAGVIAPGDILASDVRAERLIQLKVEHGIVTVTDNHALVREARVVVVAVKPQVIDKILTEIGAEVTPDTLVISLAAGVPIAAIEARLAPGA